MQAGQENKLNVHKPLQGGGSVGKGLTAIAPAIAHSYSPAVKWKTEAGASLESLRPAILIYTVTKNKETLLSSLR